MTLRFQGPEGVGALKTKLCGLSPENRPPRIAQAARSRRGPCPDMGEIGRCPMSGNRRPGGVQRLEIFRYADTRRAPRVVRWLRLGLLLDEGLDDGEDMLLLRARQTTHFLEDAAGLAGRSAFSGAVALSGEEIIRSDL